MGASSRSSLPGGLGPVRPPLTPTPRPIVARARPQTKGLGRRPSSNAGDQVVGQSLEGLVGQVARCGPSATAFLIEGDPAEAQGPLAAEPDLVVGVAAVAGGGGLAPQHGFAGDR